MSQRQRGSEVNLTFLQDGVPLQGAFLKVTSFTLTPRTDLTEEGFLGEKSDDVDIQHHGYDISWEMQNPGPEAIDVMNKIVTNEENLVEHPIYSIQVLSAYRISSVVGRSIILQNCYIKMDELAMGSRTDYTVTKYSAKSRKQNTLNNT